MMREKIKGKVSSILDPNRIVVGGRTIFVSDWDDPELYTFEKRKEILREKVLNKMVTVEIVGKFRNGELNGIVSTDYKSAKSTNLGYLILFIIAVVILILIMVFINK